MRLRFLLCTGLLLAAVQPALGGDLAADLQDTLAAYHAANPSAPGLIVHVVCPPAGLDSTFVLGTVSPRRRRTPDRGPHLPHRQQHQDLRGGGGAAPGGGGPPGPGRSPAPAPGSGARRAPGRRRLRPGRHHHRPGAQPHRRPVRAPGRPPLRGGDRGQPPAGVDGRRAGGPLRGLGRSGGRPRRHLLLLGHGLRPVGRPGRDRRRAGTWVRRCIGCWTTRPWAWAPPGGS